MSLKRLTAPLVVQRVLTCIAGTELSSRVGSEIANFVVACLNCIEGGFLGLTEQTLKLASTEVILTIRELFLRTFPVVQHIEQSNPTQIRRHNVLAELE